MRKDSQLLEPKMGVELKQMITFLFLLLSSVNGGEGVTKTLELDLQPVTGPGDDHHQDHDVPGFLKLTEGGSLNLSCEVADMDRKDKDGVTLSWYLPNHFVREERFKQSGSRGRSQLVISPVMEADTGDYECWARAESATAQQVKRILKVLVEPRRGSCQPGQYECGGGAHPRQYCIATRYRCDSHPDCPGGDDESPELCGPEPCKGKIVCPELDFRCIDPTEYCCDPHVSPDTCKFMYPCCESVIEFSIRSRYYQSGAGASPGEPERRGSSSDLVPLHSTTYAVIGIGVVAFLVIVLGLVAVICRLHLIRKSQGGAGGRGTGAGRPHPPITLHDLDIYFSERQGEVRGGEYQHIGITYNINHGVQIMPPGPAQPPPYSTNPRRLGRGLRQGARGPPPPYMSHENIAEPLLEDDNNNGDINGNSDMQDNNVRPLEAPPPPPPASNLAIPGPSGASSSSSSSSAPRASSPPPRYPGLDSSSDTDTDVS